MKKIAQIVDEKLRIVEKHFRELGDSQAIRFILGHRIRCMDELEEKVEESAETTVDKSAKRHKKRYRKRIMFNKPTLVPSLTIVTGRPSHPRYSAFFYGNPAAQELMMIKEEKYIRAQLHIDAEKDSFTDVERTTITFVLAKEGEDKITKKDNVFAVVPEIGHRGFRINCNQFIKRNKLHKMCQQLHHNRFVLKKKEYERDIFTIKLDDKSHS